MTSLKSIFDLRQEVDALRQPRHASYLNRLTDLLCKVAEHPYELPMGSEKELFDQVGTDILDELAATWEPTTNYLYRLQPLPAALYILQWPEYTDIVAAGAVDEHLDEIHNRLLADFHDASEWLPLSRYANGQLANDRGFSWWTTFDALRDDPFFAGHRLGLPDRWIPLRGLLLRCPVKGAAALARVPSVVDGFCSPIFAARREAPSPVYGETIDLRGHGPAVKGVPEYALRPVEVRSIDVLPVFIENRPEPRVPWDTPTWARIAAVYEEMKNDRW